jgi:hypothetical protein
MTRAAINFIVNKYKPQRNEDAPVDDVRKSITEPEDTAESLYYYGVMLMAHSVVTVFKNN